MFKTETHLHVKETSACGKLAAEEMVRLYHEAGYQTLFVSDHFQRRTFASVEHFTWEDKIAYFFKGYRAAKQAGEKFGMNILLAAELKFDGSPNDYLLYGIDETFFLNLPGVLEMSIEEFYPYAKKAGVTVIQAHPLRDHKCIPMPDYVDGFEVHNSNPRHENYTVQMKALAKEFHKPVTAGSDAHRGEDVGLSGVMSETKIGTTEDYVRLFFAGELKLIQGE